MENVRGKYFTFCDSDDFVAPDFYKNLYDAAEKADADIAQCGYSLYYSDENIVSCPDSATGVVIRRANGDCSKIMDVLLLSPPLTVRRIHRTSLAQKFTIGFEPDIRIAEDLLFSSQMFLITKKVVYVNNDGYFYRQSRQGRQTQIGDERLMDFFLIFDKLSNFADRYIIRRKKEIASLEINTLVYQIPRLEERIRPCYYQQFLSRLTCGKLFFYTWASFVYCWKIRLLKYYALNALCCPLLMLTAVFRNVPMIAVPLLDAVVFMRKGNFFKRFKRKIV